MLSFSVMSRRTRSGRSSESTATAACTMEALSMLGNDTVSVLHTAEDTRGVSNLGGLLETRAMLQICCRR